MTLSTEVHVFIDWDTAKRFRWLPGLDGARARNGTAEVQLAALYDALAKGLSAMISEGKITARPRIYHGWHFGNEQTRDRLALASVRPRNTVRDRVLFAPPQLSDEMACPGPHRRLRDTLRERETGGDLEQKMVDTGLAADLLFLARAHSNRPESVGFLIMSEDDDMVPPVAVASAWGLHCRILRQRAENRCMRSTRALLIQL